MKFIKILITFIFHIYNSFDAEIIVETNVVVFSAENNSFI